MFRTSLHLAIRFYKILGSFRVYLQNIPVTEDAWRAMERGIDTVAQVSSGDRSVSESEYSFLKTHPLAKAVLTALSIPYKVRYSLINMKSVTIVHLRHFTSVAEERTQVQAEHERFS